MVFVSNYSKKLLVGFFFKKFLKKVCFQGGFCLFVCFLICATVSMKLVVFWKLSFIMTSWKFVWREFWEICCEFSSQEY